MSRASRVEELEGAALHAGMKAWTGSFDRQVDRTLIAQPGASLAEGEDGPVLVRGEDVQLLGAGEHDDDLLGSFHRLAGKDPEAYRDYARRFGFLGLCEHGLPHLHSATACHQLKKEPLADWEAWSRRIRAMLAVAANLQRGRPGRAGDWEVLEAGGWPGLPTSWDLGEELETDRETLGYKMDELLDAAGVRISALWAPDEERPFLELGGYGLFQNLAREVVLTILQLDGLKTCEFCGQPFDPSRSDARYCTSACKQKAYRRRQEEETP